MLFLGVHAGAGADQWDDPVTSLQISLDGTYRAGFMYWAPRVGLFEPAEFILLGTVSEVVAPRDSTHVSVGGYFGDRYRSGRTTVTEVVRCPANLRAAAMRIRVLQCDGFDGLAVGDSVLIFLNPYEGAYAVPRRMGTNSLLGYKLPERHDLGLFDLRAFLTLLAGETPWRVEHLTPDQLRLWTRVDPSGVAEALIREREALQETKNRRKP